MIYQHEAFMHRCLQLAQLGAGKVSPNPLVGCVIVHEGKIIGEGFHRQYGQAHAEVNAIHSVTEKHLLEEATVYVSLEPCAHFGKTPPCADLLIQHKVKRVVIAHLDPFPQVSGKGAERLRAAGIEVISGILEPEARKVNCRFLTAIEKQRPYVILKWAQSADGFLDKNRQSEEQGVNWITHWPAQQMVHLWRSQEDAILVGGRTAWIDNPKLTVRHVAGKNPTRFVVQGKEKLPTELSIFSDDAPTHILTGNGPKEWLAAMIAQGVQSVIVEGGQRILQRFINEGLWDEARVFTGTTYFHEGLSAPTLDAKEVSQTMVGKDNLSLFFAA
jgi:diaminohydroxyphosphoribosylaminopyrimidine deaminase / 5-amino-6-(5-phosphoribosylamino)uracil reductase